MVSRASVDHILLIIGTFEVSQREWNVLRLLGSGDLNDVDTCKAILAHRSVSMDVSKPISKLNEKFQ